MVGHGPAADFSFVHAADLHLDTPFKGIGTAAPYVAERLREASLQAFDRLVELCLRQEAAFLVVAGDVYDGPERGLRAQLRFRDGLSRLSEAGIPSFVVHGNHDPVETGWSAIGDSWPPLVTVFPPGDVAAEVVELDGQPVATVQGISYRLRRETENLALRFARRAGPGLQVGVLHCNVHGAASGYDNYSPCTVDDLRGIGLDYWALGHVHSHMVLCGQAGSDGPWVVYSGNLQACSSRPGERGAKGAVVVGVRDGKVQSAVLEPCDSIRYEEISLDVSHSGDLAEVRDGLASASRSLLARGDGRSLIVRGRLIGQSHLHDDLRRPGTPHEILQSLRDDFSRDDPFCWWSSIEDESDPAVDVDDARRTPGFAADLIALADDLRRRLDGDDAAVAELL
jgi:DNA repair protein SbcD/Mre11